MLEDKDILKAFRESETRDHAFSLLVQKYSERLYWHIRRLVLSHEDADDLLQNTFLKAWNNLCNFREDSGLYTWLYRIATNETLNFLRSRRVRSMLSLTGRERDVETRFLTEGYFSGDEITQLLYKAIATLPPRQKTVFVMRYFEDMSMEEIAGVLGKSTGAIKASYHHAFTKIKKYLGAD